MLQATTKQPSTEKYDKDGSEDKTRSSKNKTKKTHKKIHKSKDKKRKRSDSDSDDEWYNKHCTICMPMVSHF